MLLQQQVCQGSRLLLPLPPNTVANSPTLLQKVAYAISAGPQQESDLAYLTCGSSASEHKVLKRSRDPRCLCQTDTAANTRVYGHHLQRHAGRGLPTKTGRGRPVPSLSSRAGLKGMQWMAYAVKSSPATNSARCAPALCWPPASRHFVGIEARQFTRPARCLYILQQPANAGRKTAQHRVCNHKAAAALMHVLPAKENPRQGPALFQARQDTPQLTRQSCSPTAFDVVHKRVRWVCIQDELTNMCQTATPCKSVQGSRHERPCGPA